MEINKEQLKNWGGTHTEFSFSNPYCCTSQICNRSFFDLPLFQYWCDLLKVPKRYHRKFWEWAYIAQALHERGMLSVGKKGICFGCGEEPLVDGFASFGCEIMATDLKAGADNTWVQTGQNAAGDIRKLYKGITPEADFLKRVTYRDVNMNDIPVDLTGYDFCWSSCALEHLGSLKHGLDFIHNSLKVVKPGGILVHTTEYNLDSPEETLETKDLSVYRRKDIKGVVKELEAEGHHVSPLDLYQGDTVEDGYAGVPPYTSIVHLRLMLMQFRCTSIGLIVQKAEG